MYRVFLYLKSQQDIEALLKRNLNYVINEKELKDLVFFKYPLKGIRLLFKGNIKKGKRTQKINYFT